MEGENLSFSASLVGRGTLVPSTSLPLQQLSVPFMCGDYVRSWGWGDDGGRSCQVNGYRASLQQVWGLTLASHPITLFSHSCFGVPQKQTLRKRFECKRFLWRLQETLAAGVGNSSREGREPLKEHRACYQDGHQTQCCWGLRGDRQLEY